MTSWGKKALKLGLKGVLGGKPRRGSARGHQRGTRLVVEVPIPMPKAGVCVSCGRKAHFFGQSKASGQLVAVQCSHCQGLICKKCYRHSFYNLDTPIFKHIGTLFELHPQTVDGVAHLFILCNPCKEKIGVREGKNRMSDPHTRHVNLDCDKFVEHAETVYRQSGRIEDLAQLYELFGEHELAHAARTEPTSSGREKKRF